MPFYGKNVAPDWVKDEYPLSSDGKGYFVDCGLFPEAQFTPDGGQVVTNPDGSTLTRTRQEVWRGTSLECEHDPSGTGSDIRQPAMHNHRCD